MLETKNALVDDGWVVCANCGHKLGRIIAEKQPTGLEIKCHSCKTINIVDKPKNRPKKKEKNVVQYKQPHYKHCVYYKEFTGTCVSRLIALGLSTKSQCKTVGCRTCKSFEPREEYKENYKELGL